MGTGQAPMASTSSTDGAARAPASDIDPRPGSATSIEYVSRGKRLATGHRDRPVTLNDLAPPAGLGYITARGGAPARTPCYPRVPGVRTAPIHDRQEACSIAGGGAVSHPQNGPGHARQA